MMNATAAGVAPARVKLGAHATLWIILTAILLCGAACLWGAGLQADYGSTLLVAEPLMLSVLLAWLFWALRHALSKYYVFQRLAATFEDLFLSAAQVTVVAAVSGLLIYLAAKAGATFPMRDDTLERLDLLLGFDWQAVADWLNCRPALDAFLLRAYNSLDLQISFVLLLGSALRPGQRNKEFISVLLVSIVITSAVFAFVPAFGAFGKLDEDFLDRLIDIRVGQSTMTYDCTIGIVTFPSYHTVLAFILTYSARHRYWSLIPVLLLNIVMLAATSPEGGHYLVDMLAGAVVAVASILIVRRCLSHEEALWGLPVGQPGLRNASRMLEPCCCPQAGALHLVACRRLQPSGSIASQAGTYGHAFPCGCPSANRPEKAALNAAYAIRAIRSQ